MHRFSFNLLNLAFLCGLLALAGPARAANFNVVLSSNVFVPSVLNINVGDSVTWTNQGGFHNVEAVSGLFNSGPPANPPWTFTFTFTTPGTVPYICIVHSAIGMTGVINVAGAPPVPGSIRFAEGASTVNEAAGIKALELQRIGGSDGAVSATFSTANGSATAGQDYTATTTVVNWGDGDSSSKNVTVMILEDTLDEANETVALSLSNPTGGASLGNPANATLTIIDNDDATPPPPPPPPPPVEPCVEDAETLCLLDDRFEVTALFETNQGQTGVAQAIELTPDTGYFWFFTEENVELVVKVRNACVNPFNRFWFFAGGLTNVQVDIMVTDTETGATKSYSNPLNTPFLPITDTDAFNTCP